MGQGIGPASWPIKKEGGSLLGHGKPPFLCYTSFTTHALHDLQNNRISFNLRQSRKNEGVPWIYFKQQFYQDWSSLFTRLNSLKARWVLNHVNIINKSGQCQDCPFVSRGKCWSRSEDEYAANTIGLKTPLKEIALVVFPNIWFCSIRMLLFAAVCLFFSFFCVIWSQCHIAAKQTIIA